MKIGKGIVVMMSRELVIWAALCAASLCAASGARAQTADSAALAQYGRAKAARMPWLCVEAGRHSAAFELSGVGPGNYAKAFAEMPVGDHVGLVGFVDVWGSDHLKTRYGAGLAASMTWLSCGRLRGAAGPGLFAETERFGVIFPVTMSWELFPNAVRIESTVAFRHAFEIWSESSSSRTFVTFSAGVGFCLGLIPGK
jgi:hypothetical protein